MSFVSRYLEPNLIERLNQLQLSARRVVEGSITGLHRSPVKGSSVEFRQHRFYVPGDEPRRLDWRVLGRTDRPYIKEYDEETNLRCALMLDCSGSMEYGEEATAAAIGAQKFDYAAKIVAALAYLMLGQTESVGLALFAAKLERWIGPKAGTGQLSVLIDVLERAVPRGPSHLGQAMQEVADRLDKRSLVIAVTDAFNPIAAISKGLARLHHDRHETIVIQVLHPDEVHFPFRTWSRFRGMEGERPRLCEPAVTRQAYLDKFRRHRQQLAEACRSQASEFYSVVTDKPLIECVTQLLHRRAGVR
jgi:uncharacterized protein (DUF58 family)